MKYQEITSFIDNQKSSEAREEILKQLSSNPNDSKLYNFLGITDIIDNKINSAIKNFRKCVDLDQKNYDGYCNLAINLSKLDLNNPEIIFFFKKSLECQDLNINPNYNLFLTNFGFYLLKIKSKECIIYFETAIKNDPKNFKAYLGLGQYFYEQNELDECIKVCNLALSRKVYHEGIYYDLGNSLSKKGMLNESIEAFKSSLNFNKFNFETHNSLGITYFFLGYYEKSLSHLNMAITINPKCAAAYNNAGLVYVKQNDFINAIKYFKKSYSLNKKNPMLLDSIANYYKKMNKFKTANYYHRKAINFKEIDRDILSNYIYQLSFDQATDSNFYLKEAKKINFLNKNDIRISKIGYKSNKIGFVSADFRHHPVGFFLKDVLKHLSKHFEIHCYSNNSEKDDLTEEFRKNNYHWNDILGVTAEEVKSHVLKNKIDILFDMGGHTKDNRLDIFGLRSSPIQIAWCGWLASTGLNNMDYIVIDKNIFTPDLHKNFTEKFIIMDRIWNAYSYNKIFFEKNLNVEPPCVKNDYLTFGAFHNILKINNEVVTAWSKILEGTKNKIYFISNEFTNSIFLKRFIKRFKSFGVKEEQLIFSKKMPREIFFNEYKKIDLLLDTFPYSGGSSSFETIGMNVPILTLKGKDFLSRCGYSINSNLKMQKLIAESLDDYIKIAKHLSVEDVAKFKNYLVSLDKSKSPLFDCLSFSDELSYKLKLLMKNNHV